MTSVSSINALLKQKQLKKFNWRKKQNKTTINHITNQTRHLMSVVTSWQFDTQFYKNTFQLLKNSLIPSCSYNPNLFIADKINSMP